MQFCILYCCLNFYGGYRTLECIEAGAYVCSTNYQIANRDWHFSGSMLEKFNTAMNPMAGLMNPAAVAGGNALNPNQLFPLFPFVPQNFMLSQFMNANPNANLLAKHWGEQFSAQLAANGALTENLAPVDATVKRGSANNDE